MPYIGVSPQFGVRRKHTYTATVGQTSFSGAGSEGATLSYKDSTFVDVYQNGIKLGDADYTSTSGTAIVLAQGASVDDLVEIIVFDVFSVADTVSKADGGTFDGNITAAGTLAVTGAATLSADASVGDDLSLVSDGSIVNFGENSEISLTHVHNSGLTLASSVGATTFKIGRAGATDAKILFDGNAQDYHIGVDDTNDSLVIGLGNTLGTTDYMVIDAAGAITKPLQPAFLVYASGYQNNIAVGSDVTVVFDTEVFDVNSDFASNTFTAPVTGKYQLQTTVRVQDIMTASVYYYLQLVTSNRAYLSFIIDPRSFDADVSYFIMHMTILADMDASDTAFVRIVQHSGNQQTDIQGGSSEHSTHFSGYLVA